MGISPNHYEILGVPQTASHSEIRRAYRNQMRALHPDASEGVTDTARLTRVNEAWSTLSNAKSRATYNKSLHGVTSGTATDQPIITEYFEPARFPWRGMVILAVLGIALVLFAHATSTPAVPGKPDQLLSSGSCVSIDPQLAVFEVSCDDAHDGVVRQLIALDRICPSGSQPYRDRQGMGVACVVPG